MSGNNQKLYRVQHDRSYTHYSADDGFMANARYWMEYCHWINSDKVRKPLTWADASIEPTPFMSFFDNIDIARERAAFHRSRRDKNVFVAEIDISSFVPHTLSIGFANQTIELNGIRHPPTATMIFPMKEIGPKFDIERGIIQGSEWLGINDIPPELITRTAF